MKKLWTVFAWVGFSLTASPVSADFAVGDVDWTRITGYYEGVGGEFTFWTVDGDDTTGSGLLSNAAYAEVTKGIGGHADSFQTFCVEHSEVLNHNLEGVISDTSINEGTGVTGSPGSGSHAVNGGKTYGDNLSFHTAYLYTLFATGILSEYDYTPGAGRSADAGDLEDLIWRLEEESGIAALSAQGLDWLQEAVNAVGIVALGKTPDESSAEYLSWGDTIGNVRIVNMFNAGTGQNLQDQLWLMPASGSSVVVPVPSAIILSMFGLVGVAWFKKRLS